MGETITLTASDGHQLAAYRADPAAAPTGGVVVIQEIFGVNGHVRDVVDRFAAAGYAVIAPALFDRFETGVDLDYTPDDIAVGRELKAQGNADMDAVIRDVDAAVRALRPLPIGAVGYCWGGVVCWVAALRLDIAAAACYYGAGITGYLDATPGCPVICHFGEKDASIPMDDIAAIGAARPEVGVHMYPAGHGFNCDRRADYDAASAALALERTLALFAENLG